MYEYIILWGVFFMERVDVLIIGGSAAGAAAAISSKRRNPGKSVMVIRREDRIFVPCGIPYIFGTLNDPNKNIMPDNMVTDHGVDLIVDSVVEIDREKKLVKTEKGRSINFAKLIIATGSQPARLPIPGIDKENVFLIRKDVDYLQSMLDKVNQSKNVVIIGGGFIGAEFADECKKNRDNNVTIIEKLPHCLQLAFDDEFCEEAENILAENGVKIITNKSVAAITGGVSAQGVKLSNDEEIKADVVIVSIGVQPETELARKAGMRLSESTGGIMVDRYQRVREEKDIFACGDCSMKVSFFSGSPVKTWLASVATGEARLAAANLFNIRYRGYGTVGVFSTQIGSLAIGAAGLIERQSIEEGYNVVTGTAKAPNRHPGGMPGAAATTVKLVFSKDNGVILGGEASGGSSVGEIVNIISACIQHRMTAYDVSLFQMGTHPALCASPIAYQIVNAAEDAVSKLYR
jgi:NADH oxidase (H2O2-forming)